VESAERLAGLGFSCNFLECITDVSLEGLLTVLVSAISPLLVKDWPQTAQFLTEPEREAVLRRLQRDVLDLEHKFHAKYVCEAFKNPKMYIMMFIYLGANCGTYALAFFLPSIIAGL